MTNGKTDFKELLTDLLDEQRAQVTPLTPEELNAWQEGLLNDEDRARLLNRLILDKAAVQSLIEADAAPTPAEFPMEYIEQSWAAFEQKMSAVQGSPEDGSSLLSTTSFRVTRLIYGLAACFFLATLFLGYQVKMLLDERAKHVQPSLNTQVETLYLGTSGTRNEDAPLRLSGELFILRIHISRRAPDYSSWQVTLRDPAGERLFSEQAKLQDQVLTLKLHPNFFSGDGAYPIEVYGVRNGETLLFDQTTIQIGSPK